VDDFGIPIKINKRDPKTLRVYSIWVRVEKSLFGRVYFAAERTGASMSMLAKKCLEKALDEVEQDVLREGKKKR
jgi:predicted HicB family RNase H-like nuclease